MFDFLLDLPMDLQFYILFISAMLPLSFVVYPFLNRIYHSSSFTKTRTIYDASITNKLQYKQLTINTILIFITTCIKLKNGPNDDDDDHHLSLTVTI
ncbi:hypothetical protein VBD025_14195 [Virgibacillus flavescens]|uniref:hypothetical protein n=1 Tax=Virgibacillus flavescens TaxID=1611422 RepID=UPI003D35705B